MGIYNQELTTKWNPHKYTFFTLIQVLTPDTFPGSSPTRRRRCSNTPHIPLSGPFQLLFPLLRQFFSQKITWLSPTKTSERSSLDSPSPSGTYASLSLPTGLNWSAHHRPALYHRFSGFPTVSRRRLTGGKDFALFTSVSPATHTIVAYSLPK